MQLVSFYGRYYYSQRGHTILCVPVDCVKTRVDADASQDMLDELIELAMQRSPVFDIISNPVNVVVTGEPMMTRTH